MRICDIEGCGRPHRARGLCSTHYNEIHLPNRHAGRIEVSCTWCGALVTKCATTGKSRRPVCSTDCRYALRYGRRPPTKTLVGPLPWTDTPAPTPVPEPDPAPLRQWISGPCGWCGEQFTARQTGSAGRWCSKGCMRRAGRAARRAREAGSTGSYTWAEVIRIWIDLGRICSYCAAPIEAGEVDPDHIHPLSRGGSNSITNVTPACRACNADKRDLLLDEWIDSRRERGLDPRRLDPRLRHLTSVQLATDDRAAA